MSRAHGNYRREDEPPETIRGPLCHHKIVVPANRVDRLHRLEMMAEASRASRIGFKVNHAGRRLKQNLVSAAQQSLGKFRLVSICDSDEILVESPDLQSRMPIDGEVAAGKSLDPTSSAGVEPKRIGVFSSTVQPGVLVLAELAFPRLHHPTGDACDVLLIVRGSVLPHELRRYSDVVIEKQDHLVPCHHESVIHGFRDRRFRKSVPDYPAIRVELLQRRCRFRLMARRLIDNQYLAGGVLQSQKLLQRVQENTLSLITRDCY